MSPSKTPKKSGRGGKRPGAGAPRNNLNAYKHGRYSLQTALLVQALLAQPRTRRLLLSLLKGQVPRVPASHPLPATREALLQEMLDLLRLRYGADRINAILARDRLRRAQQSMPDIPDPFSQLHPPNKNED